MNHLHWIKAGAKKLDGAFDGLKFHASNSAELVVRVEDVAEHAAQKFGCFRARVERNATVAAKAQRPQIVNAQNVIGVSMGVENGVNLANFLANRLLAEIGTGVDENKLAAVLEDNRRTSAAVASIGRAADRASAADGGHAHGSAAAQHGKGCLHRGWLPPSVPVACGGRARALVTST